jgi:coiled-coil-helix-coiled-coil-helix domain-containing protein 10
MMSGLAATVMQGMAFGTGSAIAHRAVGAVAGSMSGDNSAQAPQQVAPTVPVQATSQSSGACSVDLSAFNNCMRENNNNVTACDFYYQALQQCQASSNY